MKKYKVAFVCVHNSCRSQIAEALGKKLASDVFESYSAGTETKPAINQDAVRLMKEIYDIDMEETQHSKLLSDIPEVDVVITMGCNVNCPYVKCEQREDWGLEDPTGKSDEEFCKVIATIEEKILDLKKRLMESEEGCCMCSKKRKERDPKEMRDLMNRLKRIEGQVRGIENMLESDAYCTDILTQVSAVSAALNSFNKVLLANHVKTCVADNIRNGNDEVIDELVATLQKLMK